MADAKQEKGNVEAGKPGGEPEPANQPEESEPGVKKVSMLQMNESWFGRPIEEVDPLVHEDTFCVISKKYDRYFIYRFSSSKSLFLLGPLNPIRKFAIFVTTHRWFDILIILTILGNCITLAMITNIYQKYKPKEKVKPTYDYYIDRIEYAFLVVYTLEVVLKILSKGFLFNKFSYLRNRWNVLDLVVVASGYVTIFADVLDDSNVDKKDNDLEFLRTFRVLRAVKTLSILPGLRVMINALLSSVVQLLEVMALTVVCLMIFSLFALESFQGLLRQKCVLDKAGVADPNRLLYPLLEEEPEDEVDQKWTEWVSDWKNWKRREFPNDEPMQCGNATLTRQCGDGYTCIGKLGDNPDDGWTSFETFFNSMLSTFQLLTTDYWERLYDIVISTTGIWSIFFFLLVIFLGSYYLLNLMLAVVAMSYENEAQKQDEGPEGYGELLAKARQDSTFSFEQLSKLNICKMTYYRKRTASERAVLARKMRLSGVVDEEEVADDGRENVNLGDTIFSILGMRMALEKDDKPLLGLTAQDDIVVDSRSHEPHSAIATHPHQDNVHQPSKDERKELPGDVESAHSQAEIDAYQGSPETQQPMQRALGKASLFFRRRLKPVVTHWTFDMCIMVSIISNTVLLAMEHHGSSKELEDGLKLGNHFFMAIFTAECIIKFLALQKEYFQNGWNIFDFIIVMVSYIDLALVSEGTRGSRGLSVIRSMRLLRVFKLAQSWITMKVLMTIIFSSFGALGNLTCVLLIVIYIFAVMGMQIVGTEYTPEAFDAVLNPNKFPRWHFQNFWYAFMMVFRVLCGEWIEPLWECLKAQEKSITENNGSSAGYARCFFIFLPILIVGNFIILNLFLALLLNSFNTEEMNAQRDRELEAAGKAENLKTIVGFLLKKDKGAGSYDSDLSMSEIDPTSEEPDKEEPQSAEPAATPSAPPPGATPSVKPTLSATDRKQSRPGTPQEPIGLVRFRNLVRKVIMHNRKEAAIRAITRAEYKMKRERNTTFFFYNPGRKTQFDEDDELSQIGGESTETATLSDCLPTKCWHSSFFLCMRRWNWNRWDRMRSWALAIVGHYSFEWFILVLIIASSVTLAFEDVHLDERPKLKRILHIMNFVFTGIFVVEMILKMFALGVWNYFTNPWTILDALIVAVSLISAYFELTLEPSASVSTKKGNNKSGAGLSALKALRTFRALRPLRAISRWQGMKIVVNALIYAIPSIFNVLLVCLLFWLVFSIMGVQFFKGKFYKCVDEDGERVDARLVPNKDVCCVKSETHGYSWVNSVSNFDNVFEGYLSLFQIATFEGWMELMEFAVDSVDVDKQPIIDHGIQHYAFFVIFIVFGSFFTLNLFIGVIIDNFNMLKKKYEGNLLEVLLTPNQRRYYTVMKKLGIHKPRKVIKRPSNKVISIFYDIAMSRKFEIAIFFLIFLNMVIMGFEHYGQPLLIHHITDGFNAFFTTIYALEAIVKIIGLRYYYFTVPWNVFDFVLVVASLLDLFLGELSVEFPIPPTMLRIVRIIRIGRVLRLVKAAKGIRKLLFALVVSLPALFNIGALLALITFIYAILGMALFGRAPRKWSIDDVFNFDTFMTSMLMLFRLMTAAGWNEVLDSLTVVEPVCGSYRHIQCGLPNEPECPSRPLVVAYIVTYLVVSYLIVINMYIAIILENFVEANNEEEVGIVEDDLEMFYLRWSRYDPQATQFINFEQLSDFLASLDPPLALPKPNMVAVVMFNLPIARGDKIHCLGILHALVKYVLGQVEDSKEFRKLQEQMERKFQKQFPTRRLLDIVSSTRQWKIENNAAIIIQRAWRRYWARKHPPPQKEKSTHTVPVNNETKSRGGMGGMMVNMLKEK